MIGDPHGNIEGLREALKKLQNTDTIFCSGDLTGYYPFINEVFDILRQYNVKTTLGNHDQALATGKSTLRGKIGEQSYRYAKRSIDEKNLKYLLKTPTTIKENIDGITFNIFHGSPKRPIDRYVYPHSKEFEEFEKCLDICIIGHTHIQFSHKRNQTLIINPGSCGQPRDLDPRAAYAIFDTDTTEINMCRVDYNREKMYDAIIENELDPILGSYLYLGSKLDKDIITVDKSNDLVFLSELKGWNFKSDQRGTVLTKGDDCVYIYVTSDKRIILSSLSMAFDWDPPTGLDGLTKRGRGYVLEKEISLKDGDINTMISSFIQERDDKLKNIDKRAFNKP